MLCVFFSHSLLSEVRKAGLNSHVVCDAGRTQIAPGSQTVLCIGPGVCLLCCVYICKIIIHIHWNYLSVCISKKSEGIHEMDVESKSNLNNKYYNKYSSQIYGL